MFSGIRRKLRKGGYQRRTRRSTMLTTSVAEAKGSIGNNSASTSSIHQSEPTKIELDVFETCSISFLSDGSHFMSGGEEGKLRCRRVVDGQEVGTAMDVGSPVSNIAMSRDGKWVASGTNSGMVTVWSTESHEKVAEFRGHRNQVAAMDISPDATRIATGSDDKTVCIWSISAGHRLLDPLPHDHFLTAIKYSPNGRFIATAASSIRIYNSQKGRLLVDIPIRVSTYDNQSLAWSSNSKQLFVLSDDGNIKCLDVSRGTTVSQWPIHSSDPGCIALASNGTFIVASANSRVSLWDTVTCQQIGPSLQYVDDVVSMAISPNYDLATCGGTTITLLSLCEMLPPQYINDIDSRDRDVWRMQKLKANREETIESLRNEISDLRAQHERSNKETSDLNATVQELRTRLVDAEDRAEEKDSLKKTVGFLLAVLHAHEQKHDCETLYREGRIIEAAESLLELTTAASEAVAANKLIMDWVAEFTHRCVTMLENIGDEAFNDQKHDKGLTAYGAVLSLTPSTPETLLAKWAGMILIHSSANESLSAAAKFKLPRFVIYQALCDVLEKTSRVTEAIGCFRQMKSELTENLTSARDEQAHWELLFLRRCAQRLEKLADTARDSEDHDEAIKQYSTALSLNPTNLSEILFKRCRARVRTGSWNAALNDADKIIELEPLSHRGYEGRHAALHGEARYKEAAAAFKTMISILEQSPDRQIRELRHQYVDATPIIRKVVEQTVLYMPRILIDTTTGHLCDKKKQTKAFEALPIHDELVSSMTAQLDRARILREVKRYYRYVMLSHRWDDSEPLFQEVVNIAIYELKPSLANDKLQMFCSFASSLGFQWAWSDTCCVDKLNNVVLQESLVAMFAWYRGSSLTIVYLRGVSSSSLQPGGLQKSIWNTRAWTYQEYIASEVVQFYTEDWKPYLGLDMFNHKESPVILSEMEQVMHVSTQQLATLRPGLDKVREKLYLASMRQTTLVEDAAYSLFGIFNVAISAIYGEGNRAVGRLLDHILTSSGGVTILAWTGSSGSYNSCLPEKLTVYNQLAPPHIPPPIDHVEMDRMIRQLHSSLPDLSLAVELYDRLNKLPAPLFVASRLRLPGIIFPVIDLAPLSEAESRSELHVYRATTPMLGDVEIKSTDGLSELTELVLIHPWVSSLLDQEFQQGTAGLDDTMRALRLVVHLKQPFGALLLAPISRVQYRRVATNSLIIVRVREEASLTDLIDKIHTIDIQ